MTPTIWNENSDPVPAGWILGVHLRLTAKPSSSRVGDAQPQRKHDRRESHTHTHTPIHTNKAGHKQGLTERSNHGSGRVGKTVSARAGMCPFLLKLLRFSLHELFHSFSHDTSTNFY